jgi:hypothetical protein
VHDPLLGLLGSPKGGEDIPMLNTGLSIVAILVSIGSLVVSLVTARQAKQQAEKASGLSSRLEGINHILNAMYDVNVDGNITARTVGSIRDAFQLSELVFTDKITNMLAAAHTIASRLQGKSFERQNDQDIAALTGKLNTALAAMKEHAAFRA